MRIRRSMIRWTTIVMMLATVSATQAQQSLTDSLILVLQNHKSNDTAKVNLMTDIAYSLYRNNKSVATDYARQSAELSDKLNYQKGKASSLWIFGLINSTIDKQLSLEYFEKALAIAEENNDKHGIATYLMSSANILSELDKLPEAVILYEKALEIAREIKDKKLEIKNLINLSRVNDLTGNFSQAIDQLQNTIALAQEVDDKQLIATCYSSMSTIYIKQGNYSISLEYLLKAKTINELINNKIGVIINLINIAGVKTSQKDYKSAISTLEEGINKAKEIDNKSMLSACYTNIGNIYLTIDDDRALENLQKGLSLLPNNNIKQKINILTSIGDIYGKMGDNDKAFTNLNQAKSLAEEGNFKYEMANVWYSIGKQLFRQKEYVQSLDFARRSNEIAIQMEINDLQKDNNELMAENYAKMNDYRKAFEHHKIFKQLNDSIFNESNTKKIADLESAYKFDKERQQYEMDRQKKNLEIKNHKNIIATLSAATILMLLLALTLYRLYKLKRRTNKVLVEQKSKIEELNEEYKVVNEMLSVSNKELTTAKQQIEESEEKLQLIINNSNDITLLLNKDLSIAYLSKPASQITGYGNEELHELPLAYIHPDDRENIEAHWHKVLSNGKTTERVQFRLRHKDNHYIWLEAMTNNYLDHQAIGAVLSNIRDIDVQKRAEVAFIEREQLQKQLLQSEIERQNYELESNRKNMTAAALKLVQNAERDARSIKSLISDYKLQAYTTNWDEFELLFQKVHHSFYSTLSEQFPELTHNERKLCVFLKLNMNSKQISQITFQSEEALKKARLRLRKKLNIDRDTNLTGFIQNLQ